jgi:hypothetical protein
MTKDMKLQMYRARVWLPILACGFWLSAQCSRAQGPLVIYSDGVVNSWQDWSWATRNMANTTPVHGGTRSIGVTANYWEGISFHHSDFSAAPYASFSFWTYGGTNGGQRLQVYAEYGYGGVGTTYSLPSALTANAWKQYVVPLASLGISNQPSVNRITIQLQNSGTAGTFYLDDIQFDAQPVPALVNINVDAMQLLQTVDVRHFGVNLACWDIYYDSPSNTTTAALLREMGCKTVRMPGGSLSDEYHWQSNTSLTNTWQWQASFGDMLSVNTNVGVQAFITVNYGTGTPEEAAGWVRHANITNHLGYKFWEIGNECYGGWETDSNTYPHDPYTYAVRATNYMAQMRAADPSIKIGVVVVAGEGSSSNQYNSLHPAYNPRTGQTNYGWTPILLSTLKSIGGMPDFVIHHVYPQWTDSGNPSGSPDNDTNLMQTAAAWATDAANLRQQISDYFGPAGTNIELVCTENNSDSGAQGRQSTSLVNGLYYADSLSQLLKTEFKGFVWWDLRNNTDTAGFFGSSVYGWRSFGDLGMINGLKTRLPTFYAAKLMQWLARPGDRILGSGSDYGWISTCAARRTNGSVTLLVLNKFNYTNLTGQVSLAGFTPSSVATVRSYGILNDEATRTNGPTAAQDITTNVIANAGTSFTYAFPRYSMTLISLSPAAPGLAVVPPAPVPGGEIVLQIQGQAGVPYVLQSSTNNVNWTPVSTNWLTGTTLNVTNSLTPGTDLRFWRAIWQP